MSREKAHILNSFEKWVIFPNKFVQIATVCADLHNEIVAGIRNLTPDACPKLHSGESREYQAAFKAFTKRSSRFYRSCLELSLLTPVMAEAFINIAILILCKAAIKNNQRQFEAFIRSPIDAKIFDLSFKCEGFIKNIDHNSPIYKDLKRVMDKRNNTIHGNVSPEKEKIEIVYFEGTRPLFVEPGDHIAQRFESMAQQYEPEAVVKDYEAVHAFLWTIATCLEPSHARKFWQIIETEYPGYDVNRKIMGFLLPEHLAVFTSTIRYDDELAVDWTNSVDN